MQLKTIEGFKVPELWDLLYINDSLTPMITKSQLLDRIMIFRDILIDGNMITPEGIVFRYSD